MSLTTLQLDALPRAAWCLQIARSSLSCVLRHGPGVETRDDFFFEGVWDGDFLRPPESHHTLCGTGGTVGDQQVELYASGFKVHGLYVTEVADTTFAANSLPLLLACTGLSLSNSHPYVAHWKGIVALGWRAVTADLQSLPVCGGAIDFYSHGVVSVQRQQTVASPRDGKRFDENLTYQDYRSHLDGCLAGIIENARHPTRRTPIARTVATLSAGYDSTATAVLARDHGCKHAVTIDSGDGDSGAEIGRRLELNTKVVPVGYPTDINHVASVLSMPGNLVHLPWFEMQPVLANAVAFTGWYGDAAWSIGDKSTQPGHYSCQIGQEGLPESRLWMDCIFVSPAAIGDADLHHVAALSRSPEMTPYRVGGNYDRPIPRRIAREADVEDLLAHDKLGTSAQLDAHSLPESVVHAIDEMANALELGPVPDALPAEFSKIGWSFQRDGWSIDSDQGRDQILLLEGSFRWAVCHLAREYAARLTASP